MRILTLNGRRYALGLSWQPFKGLPGITRREEAATMLRTEKARLGVIFENNGRPIVGALLDKNAPRGAVYSAALAVAARDSTALVVADLGGGKYWICQAGGGQFNPDTDEIVAENVAIERVRAIYSQRLRAGATSVATFITPGVTFDAPGLAAAERMPLEQLLAVAPPASAQLEVLGGRSQRELVVVSFSALFVLAMGGHFAWQWKTDRDRQLQQLRDDQARLNVEVDAGREREAAIETAVRTALRDDTRTPLPSQLVERCLAASDAIGEYPGGWQVLSVRCDSIAPTATVAVGLRSNDPATIGDPETLHAFARTYGVAAAVAPSLRDGSVSVPLLAVEDRTPVATTEGLPPLLTFQTEQAATLVRYARVLPGFTFQAGEFVPKQLTFTELDPTTQQLKQSPVPAERVYREATLTIEATAVSDLPVSVFDVPYARLDRLEIFRTQSGRRFAATFRLFVGV